MAATGLTLTHCRRSPWCSPVERLPCSSPQRPGKRIENSSRGVRKKVIHTPACSVPRLQCKMHFGLSCHMRLHIIYNAKCNPLNHGPNSFVNNLCTIGESPEGRYRKNICASASQAEQALSSTFLANSPTLGSALFNVGIARESF
jgi:hypothetical protein